MFEHCANAQKRGQLTTNSSGQVLFEYKESYEHVYDSAEDPEFIEKIKKTEGFALGDDDLGAIFTFWLIEKIKQGDDIRKYEDIVKLVSDHDKKGRIALYPKGESISSLVMTNWGIMLSSEDDVNKVAQYTTVFDYLSQHPEHLHDGIPAPTKDFHLGLEMDMSSCIQKKGMTKIISYMITKNIYHLIEKNLKMQWSLKSCLMMTNTCKML